MVRKSGDLMSLLSQRSNTRRSRSSGFGTTMQKVFRRIFRRADSPIMTRRRNSGAGLSLTVVVLLLLSVGYVVGNAYPFTAFVPWRSGDDKALMPALSAGAAAPRSEPVAPGPLGDDGAPMTGICLIAAAYKDKALAMAAARNLREQGIGTARAIELAQQQNGDGPLWGLVAYCKTKADELLLRTSLQQARSPDATFDHFRKTQNLWPSKLASG